MIQVKHNIPLAPLSTFGIGGSAKEYMKVANADQFLEALQWAIQRNKEFVIFSGASNVVFPDAGLDCLVIHVSGGTIQVEKNVFLVDGGVELKDAVEKSIQLGLSGLESLSGIPGTAGGAIVGNAGAYGRSIADAVEKVFVFDGEKTYWFGKQECQFAYRESIFKHKKLFLLKAQLLLQNGNKAELIKTSNEIIALRKQKYKPGIKCPGSFFKNVLVADLLPEKLSRIDPKWIKYGKIPAGYLLEEVGAKGMKLGGIQVAEYHGNLLLNNKGNGKAKEVKELAGVLKQKVKEKFGIELEEEVRYF